MTYTYRLSKRLAVLRRTALMALVAATMSCSQDLEPNDPLAPSLGVSRTKDSGKPRISPDSTTLAMGQTSKFVAYVTVGRGDSSQVQVTWSASGGTINSTGEFTSDSAGTFRVVARRSWKGQLLSDTARVAVMALVDSATPIVRLIVSPDTATVSAGQSRKFTAMAKLSDSSTATAIVSWSATGGTIDSTGSFKADTVPGKFRVTATSTVGALSDTAAVVVPAPPPPPPVLTRLVLTPDTAKLQVGQTQQFSAYGRLSTGDSVAVAVTYAATGGLVTSAGMYSATSAGTFRVVATQQGGPLADSSTVVTTAVPPPQTHAGYQATPGGSSTGDGSAGAPWSLSYALSGAGGRIAPGDTLWLRGGTYPSATLTSTLTGASGSPIIVRQWPGERARLTGILQIRGADTWYMDFEHANTSTALNSGSSIDLHGARVKLIGLTIHDGGGNGVGVWSDAPNAEVAGCTIYNNGWNSPAGGGGYGHGIYVQSSSPNTAVLRDNAIYDNYAWGIHGYTEGGDLSGIQMIGNAVWNSGVPGPREPLPNLFVGSGTTSANRILVRRNMLFLSPSFAGSGDRMAEFGYGSQNADIVVDSNVIVNGNVPLHLTKWTTATVRANQIVSTTGALVVDGSHSGYSWGGNAWVHNPSDPAWVMDAVGRTFSAWQTAAGSASTDVATGSSPTDQRVFVRANPYEPGRGLVVVYNWSGAGTVSADLSSIARGRTVEVRHAHAPLGSIVASGSGVVSLPMANVTPPTPLPGWAKPVPVTGPTFNVFVVTAP
jgi:Right handed beta helix region